MWTHLDPQKTTLEEVYKPLHSRSEEFGRLWSIAELRLSDDDLQWLRSWIGNLTPESTENWIKTVLLTKYDGNQFLNYRQMFGSILICIGAEICRRESREDSVWPTFRIILPKSHALRRELFLPNGQPTTLTKDIISDAVSVLNLRHAMDIEGTQQWFTTIKLQYGFTYKGAKNRLAEWLVNLSQPHSVQYLCGESEYSELSSVSFRSMWNALKQYRRGLIEKEEVLISLKSNPWIRPDWIDDLLHEAREKISTLGTGEWSPQDSAVLEEVKEEFCPITQITLDWQPGTVPRIKFELDHTAIESETNMLEDTELDFYIDGKKLGRWLRQKDGSWSGKDIIFAELENNKEQPNLTPRVLSIQSGSGETILEWDFADSGLIEEVLVFDLVRERMVKTGTEKLIQSRQYAIICDRSCTIHGCNPTDTFERNGLSKKVIRLPSLTDTNFYIAYDDFILWQPVKEEGGQRQQFSLSLTTPDEEMLLLNERSILLIEGLPEGAVVVELLIKRKRYEITYHNNQWQTSKEIKITPELAARQLRLRVRFSIEGSTYTLEPRLDFNILGAAMLQYKQSKNKDTLAFEVLDEGDLLNKSEGTSNLKVWVPDPGKTITAYEGGIQVGKLRFGKVQLKDFSGFGGELQIMNQGIRYNLRIPCIDKGYIREFLPSLFNREAQIFLQSEKSLDEVGEKGYALYIWTIGENQKAKFHMLSPNSIKPTNKASVWKIQETLNPLSIVLTWMGVWLGAWWNLDKIHNYLSEKTGLREQDFAIIKWLRIPVLHPKISLEFKKHTLNEVAFFMDAWLNDKSFSREVKPHINIQNTQSVLRHFLWNDFPIENKNEAISIITNKEGKWYNIEKHCIHHLENMSDISPILLWIGLKKCLENNQQNIIYFLKVFTYSQLHLPFSASQPQFNYRLSNLKNRTLLATGIEENRLEELINSRIQSLKNEDWLPLQKDQLDLLKIGESISGRKYLNTRIGRYWLSLANN